MWKKTSRRQACGNAQSCVALLQIHNDQARWLCNPNNRTEPFDHIETECSPCGGYYRTGKDNWVRKDTHDSVRGLWLRPVWLRRFESRAVMGGRFDCD